MAEQMLTVTGLNLRNLSLRHVRSGTTKKKSISQRLEPRTWDSASLCLMRVVDNYTATITPLKSIDLLQRFFKIMGLGIEIFDMTLISIVGDSCLALNSGAGHHRNTIKFAIFCISAAGNTLIDPDNPSEGAMQVRTAVHSGNVHCIVLDASPFRYTVIGPSMTIVKFLETEGSTGAVHCSASVINLIHADNPPDKKENKSSNHHTNILISPHTTMVLEILNAHPTYKDEYEKNNRTHTYIVSQLPLTIRTDEVMVYPNTLNRLCVHFGYSADELRMFA